MAGDSSGAADLAWWGSIVMADNQVRRWQIGPLSLWIECLKREWRTARLVGDDALESNLEVAAAAEAAPDDSSGALFERFVRDSVDRTLTIRPALADRPVVTRPEGAFSILPREETELFVSTPCWVRLEPEADGFPMSDFPIFRPSDTWFGPSTMEGELCYASRTNCRLALDDLPPRPHRAVTAIRIRNKANTSLKIERLGVPVPNLSLFSGKDGRLWTEPISFTRESEDEGLVKLHIDRETPFDGERVADPRSEAESGSLIRAFAGFL